MATVAKKVRKPTAKTSTKKKYNIYNSPAYKKWRAYIFKRDRYTCQLCGTQGSLEAHHIKKKSKFPHLTFDTTNGITLCKPCHNIITGNEPLFSILFSSIVKRNLTLDYVYEFMSKLIVLIPHIVEQFKSKNRWDKIPDRLIRTIKNQ